MTICLDRCSKHTRNDDAWRAVALNTAAHRNGCDERNARARNYIFATVDGRKFATATMRKSSAQDGVSNAHATSKFGPLAPMYNVGECARESALRNLRVSYDPLLSAFLRTILDIRCQGFSRAGACVADACSCSLRTFFRQQSAGKRSKGLLNHFVANAICIDRSSLRRACANAHRSKCVRPTTASEILCRLYIRKVRRTPCWISLQIQRNRINLINPD